MEVVGTKEKLTSWKQFTVAYSKVLDSLGENTLISSESLSLRINWLLEEFAERTDLQYRKKSSCLYKGKVHSVFQRIQRTIIWLYLSEDGS